jgi:FkbM family methyltransferase
LPYYCLDLPHKIFQKVDDVVRASEIWADDASRYEYLAHLRWRTLLDFDCLPDPDRDGLYFPKNIYSFLKQEVMVDCGAYVGDTIRDYIRRDDCSFKKIIALEPDPLNFKRLTDYISGLNSSLKKKIEILPFAVGSVNKKVFFSSTGLPSSEVSDDGSVEVESRRLDDILNGEIPTFIKMDIEGSEPDALIGATNRIKESQPVLAISVYHKQSDIWEIPLLIKSLSDNYSFFLRSHRDESWDLVCYAVPANRLRIPD